MTSWNKLGLVYDASKYQSRWAKNSALTPTPIIKKNGDIRVFCGFRDQLGVSRIGYVDLDSKNPSKILKISKTPALDIGRPGCFDDNGVILGDVVGFEGRLYLFYVGFQLAVKVKFLAFTGLAVSDDDGESFSRFSDAPILDRHSGENYFAAVHSASFDNGKWRLWYGAGDHWRTINGKQFPSYGVNYLETNNLLSISSKRYICLSPSINEYRIGRPRVYFSGDKYEMHFTAGTLSGEYYPGTAISLDGKNWQRTNENFYLPLSESGWDSRHISYPVTLSLSDRSLVFYNGNDMGINGFGVAQRMNLPTLRRE